MPSTIRNCIFKTIVLVHSETAGGVSFYRSCKFPSSGFLTYIIFIASFVLPSSELEPLIAVDVPLPIL